MKQYLRPMRRTAWVATAVLLAAACSSDDGAATSGEGGETAATSVATTIAPPTTTTAGDDVPGDVDDGTTSDVDTEEATAEDDFAALAEMRNPSEPYGVAATFDADAEHLVASFAPLEPGTYRSGAVGTPLSFVTTEPLFVQPNERGTFVITDESSRGPDDRDLVAIRVGNLSDPMAPNAPVGEQTPWPNDDFRGWLESLPEGVIRSSPVDTTVNGFEAISVDMRLSDDIDCGYLPGTCVGVVDNNAEEAKGLNKRSVYRMWFVEQDDEDPILITAAINNDEDGEWFPRAEAILDTMAFGDVTPNLVTRLVDGTNQLPSLGGIEVTLPDAATLTNDRSRHTGSWSGRGFWTIDLSDLPGVVYLSDRPHGFDGLPLESADELLSLLEAAEVTAVEADAVTIDGVEARVFDLTADPLNVFDIAFRFSPDDLAREFFGWDVPAAGRMWIIEHPDRGLMTISTHAFDAVEATLPLVNTLGETIVGSLVFVD